MCRCVCAAGRNVGFVAAVWQVLFGLRHRDDDDDTTLPWPAFRAVSRHSTDPAPWSTDGDDDDDDDDDGDGTGVLLGCRIPTFWNGGSRGGR